MESLEIITCEICGGIPQKEKTICKRCEIIAESIKDSPRCEICGNFEMNVNYIEGDSESFILVDGEYIQSNSDFLLCDNCLKKIERYIYKTL